MTINKFKNRRWDCDVSLDSGIPYTFPLFHGWNESRRKIIFGSRNFHTCLRCGEWVSDIDIETHNCSKDYQNSEPIDQTEEDINIIDETPFSDMEEEEEESPLYVVITDDNYETTRCILCQDQMKIEFLSDLEEWVFMACVEHDGSVIHKFCCDVVYKKEDCR